MGDIFLDFLKALYWRIAINITMACILLYSQTLFLTIKQWWEETIYKTVFRNLWNKRKFSNNRRKAKERLFIWRKLLWYEMTRRGAVETLLLGMVCFSSICVVVYLLESVCSRLRQPEGMAFPSPLFRAYCAPCPCQVCVLFDCAHALKKVTEQTCEPCLWTVTWDICERYSWWGSNLFCPGGVTVPWGGCGKRWACVRLSWRKKAAEQCEYIIIPTMCLMFLLMSMMEEEYVT